MNRNFIKPVVAFALALALLIYFFYGMYEALFNGLVYVKHRGWQTFQQSPVKYLMTVTAGMIVLLVILFATGVVMWMIVTRKRAGRPILSPRYRRDASMYDNRIVRPFHPDSEQDP